MKMVEGVIAENADFQTSTSTSELEDCTGEVKKMHMQVQRCNQSGCQCFETNVADAMKNGTDARKMCQPEKRSSRRFGNQFYVQLRFV